MRVTHHIEPFVGACLGVAVEELADAVDENFRAAARNAVETRGHQSIDHGWHGKLGHARKMDHFGWRERVELERGKTLFDCAKQIFVPLERQVWIVAALEQQLDAANRNRFFDLAEDLLEAEHVTITCADLPVERTKIAARHTDIRVIDVAIDDVGDDAFRMASGADQIGGAAEPVRWRFAIEEQRLVGGQTAALFDATLKLTQHAQ